MLKYKGMLMHVAMAIIDAALVAASMLLTLYLRFDGLVPKFWLERLQSQLWPTIIIFLTSFFIFGFYKRVWRYASIDDLMTVVVAVTAGSAGFYLFSRYYALLPRSTYMISWFLLIIFVGGAKLAVRFLADNLYFRSRKKQQINALIYGAGEAGVLVARELKKQAAGTDLKVTGFIDDDPAKRKQIIQGLPVLGSRSELPELVSRFGIEELIIAMPSAPYSELQAIIAECAKLPVHIKTVPSIYEIVKGEVNISALKKVEIEDLLQRPPVEVDLSSIAAYLENQVVLVTGAGGSIGSELCRQIAALKPAGLLMLDHDENGIFYITHEMEELAPTLKVVPLVTDVQNSKGLKNIFEKYLPAVVFHAAAYKHVPLMETNTEEAVRNNISGSKNLIDLAAACGVKRFVAVSTDKAVNPTSVMGATKRAVEIYLQQKARQCHACVFCAVRFGNVLGSQGSVVHLFRKQIAKGGPVTVTHPEMERYFMTIPEAVQLVIQAGALGRGGEIFVLDMGEPVKIMDLARDMIILSGLKPGEDVEIKICGLRPGEKLFEELFSDRENFNLTRHEKIFIAPDSNFSEELIKKEIEDLSLLLGEGSLDGLLVN